MGVTRSIVLTALCATVCFAGTAGEGEYAARLEARLDSALERILGPGRAAAIVEVRGERVTKREESSISGYGGRGAQAGNALLDLPGYTKKAAPALPPAGTVVHSASEQTVSEGSFDPSGVRAWLFLDEDLDDAAAAAAVQLSMEILAVDPARGDTLKVVRTAISPAWRAAFSRPRDLRILILLGLAAAAALLSVVMIGFAAVRSARAAAEAVSKASAPSGQAPLPQAAETPPDPSMSRRIQALPPLEDGGREQ